MNIWICLSWGMLAVGLGGLLISCLHDRERILTNHIIVFGSFEAIVFYSEYVKAIKICISCILACCLCCWILIWCRSIKRHKKKVVRKRIKKSFFAANSIMGLFLGCLMLVVSLSVFWKEVEAKEGSNHAYEEVIVTYGDEYRFDENADTIANFQEERWEKLDKEKRLEAAKSVAYCEARYLGIWTPLTVVVQDLGNKDIKGSYDERSHTIYLNENYLMKSKAEEVLKTICHECYHAYSFRLIDLYQYSTGTMKNLYIFNETQQYLSEFQNYIGAEDPFRYFLQKCEKDARDYAKASTQEYYELIEKYLAEAG